MKTDELALNPPTRRLTYDTGKTQRVMTPETLKPEAQAALDELMRERQLPFRLEAREMIPEEGSRYTIRFHDSRLHSVTVTCAEGQPFKEVVRAAVLERVSRLDGMWDRRKQ